MASWYMPLLVAPSTALWASPFHPVLEVVTSAPKARLSASMVCGRRGGDWGGWTGGGGDGWIAQVKPSVQTPMSLNVVP